MFSVTHVSRLYRLLHGLLLWRARKENGMGCLGQLWWCHSYIFRPSCYPLAYRNVQESLPVLGRFVVLVYDRKSEEEAVNGARKHLFTKMGSNIEAIPPTQAALVEHTKRAGYTAGRFCMGTIHYTIHCPSFSSGLEMDQEGWCLGSLQEGTPRDHEVCRELLRCRCKIGCSGQCKCMKAALQCTALGQCGGQCWVYKGHDYRQSSHFKHMNPRY